MADSTPYKVPAEPGRWFAIGLAAAVHAVLFAILWIGVRWENEAPTAVDAEIWTEQAQQTPTPRPQPVPEPVAKPEPKQEPKPEPQPVIKELPKSVQKQPEPLVKDPKIALEQEKKRKLLEQQRLAEAKLREQEKAKAEKQKLAAELKQAEADKQRKLQQAEAEAELRRKQAEAEQRQKQQQAEAAAKRKQEQAAAAEKKRKQELAQAKAAQAAAEKAAAEKAAADERHAENLKRLMTQAGASSTGGGAKAQGGAADGRYVDRIRTKIKSNTIFNVPSSLGDNPAVEYAIDLLPDGSLRGMRKLKSSGVTGFDEAVALAIERSQPFPPDDSGKIPARLTITHRPKDQ